jgi:hypothetical protein
MSRSEGGRWKSTHRGNSLATYPTASTVRGGVDGQTHKGCLASYSTEYLWLNGKLRLYALQDCTDQLRRLHGISIYITNRERLGDIYIVTARAKDRTGREDESAGAVALDTLKGDALANALMKCETKAKRRVTLSLAGLGWLDETEIVTIPGVRVGEPNGDPEAGAIHCTGMPPDPHPPKATRLSHDQARALKQVAQTTFGYPESERRLRADLGFEPDERLTLRHLVAHVTAEQYQTLMDGYAAILRQEVESDLPDFPPPAAVTTSGEG